MSLLLRPFGTICAATSLIISLATGSWGARPVSTTEPEVLRYARFLPSGNLFTVGALDKDYNGGCHGEYSGNRISTWNVDTGKRLLVHQYKNDLEEVTLSPDGKLLASWPTKEDSDDANGTIDFRCTSEISATFGTGRSIIHGGNVAIQQATFSPDSRKFAFSYHWGSSKDNPDTKLRKKDIRVYVVSPPQEFCWLTTDEQTATELKRHDTVRTLATERCNQLLGWFKRPTAQSSLVASIWSQYGQLWSWNDLPWGVYAWVDGIILL